MSITTNPNRKRVVLADDHPIFLDGLQRLLQVEYDVVACLGRGDDFIARSIAARPDLIVADDALPQMQGLAARESLQTAGLAAKLVVLTRSDDTRVAVDAIQRGVDAFVMKRSASTELLAAVRAALAGERWISPSLAVRIIQSLRDEPSELNQQAAQQLSTRQKSIIAGLVRGQIAKHIASDLGISRKTVEYHKYRLMEQLGLRSTAELIQFAVRNGLDRSTPTADV